MSSLTVVAGPLEGMRFAITNRAETVIGRDGVCDIVLPTGTVSRRHARILREGDRCYLEDLGSNNGTFVNGRRIEGRVCLKPGDRINLYQIGMVYQASEAVPAGDLTEAPLPGADGDHSAPFHPDTLDASETCIIGRVPDTDPEAVIEGPAESHRAELRSIAEINRRLGSSLDLDEVLPRVLDLLFDAYPHACSGQILLLDDQGQLFPRALKHGRDDDSAIFAMQPVDHDLASRVIRSGTVCISNGQESQSVLDDAPGFSVTAPILGPSGRSRGVICLDFGSDEPLELDTEAELIQAVAAATGQTVEHAAAHQLLLEAERQLLRMETAREVQLQMLPRSRPEIPGYQLADYYSAAEEVGGDYYSYFRLPDNRLMITVGDIGGKGLQAALRMAQLSAEVRHCLLEAASVKRAMRRLNRECFSSGLGFITFVFCLLDPGRNEITIANAGHPPPLLRQASGTVETLWSERDGCPFGVLPDQEFHPTTWPIAEGDVLLLATDGLTEAMNLDEELFGSARIRDCLALQADTPADVLGRLLAEVGLFRKGKAPSDDLCLVSLKRQTGTRPEPA